MNKARRKELERAIGLLSEARDIIQTCCEEEQEAFDNMPEGLQSSERGEQMEEYISTMEEAVDNLEEMEGNIEEITSG